MNQLQLGSFESIPLSSIRPSGTNPRKHFDQLALDELTRSVQEKGVTTPLLLRPAVEFEWTSAVGKSEMQDFTGGRPVYQIVAGERRYRAALAAGVEDVPAIIREISDEEALDLQMIENLQRADLHPMEEAEGYRVLEAHGATAADIARRSGKTIAHVVQRMRLLTLELDAREMFADGHLTLGHALLLARLTPEQQDRAIRFMLNGTGDYSKTPTHDLLARRVENLSRDYMRGYRLVDTTEAQLKAWIESNVLLQLANVPWHLADESLVPAAGACTTCPKRTGANIALFGELTTDDDTCTDPVCFGAKQAAQLKRQQDALKTSGKPVLKISSKSSHEKLEEKAVEVKKGATTVTKKTVKDGQWVASEEAACGSTIQALMQDGPDKGKLLWVCPDQKCKVHKHTVHQAYSQHRTDPAKEAAAKEKRRDVAACELKIRAAILAECRQTVTPNAAMLRDALLASLENYSGGLPVVAASYGIELPEYVDTGWDSGRNWRSAVRKLLEARVGKQNAIAPLIQMLFDLQLGNLLEVNEWDAASKHERERVAKLAREHGVDADAIARRITAEHDAPKLELRAQASNHVEEEVAKSTKKKLTAAEQAARKKTAAKKFPNRALSAEQRKNIVEAQKKRFAKAQAGVDGKSKAAGAVAEMAGA